MANCYAKYNTKRHLGCDRAYLREESDVTSSTQAGGPVPENCCGRRVECVGQPVGYLYRTWKTNAKKDYRLFSLPYFKNRE